METIARGLLRPIYLFHGFCCHHDSHTTVYDTLLGIRSVTRGAVSSREEEEQSTSQLLSVSN